MTNRREPDEDPFAADATTGATFRRPVPGGGGSRRPVPPGRHVPAPPSAAPTPGPVAPLAGNVAEPFVDPRNPLASAAGRLVLMAGQFRVMTTGPDVAALRDQVGREVKAFRRSAESDGYTPETVDAAHYLVCVTLDEAVLATPWGRESEWRNRSLQGEFHGDRAGGEEFFVVLDAIRNAPDRYIDLLEVAFLCLAVGFQGRYRREARGARDLADLRKDVYALIASIRGPAPAELSERWRGLPDRRHRVMRYLPWWVMPTAAAAVLVMGYVLFSLNLSAAAAPVHAALARVGTDDVPVAISPRPVTRTLKQLLDGGPAASLLRVEENAGRTRITPIGGELFASGSAEVTATYASALQTVAAAMREVPGRVTVTGHTDDQPIRSLQYRDNVELSRARASSVAQILERGTGGRIGVNGAGSALPLYQPPDTPANRARNRRVEIIHDRD